MKRGECSSSLDEPVPEKIAQLKTPFHRENLLRAKRATR